MDTLKINIPSGFKVENFDQTTGEINFAPIPNDIKERLQTMADIFAFHGTTAEEFDAKFGALASDTIGYEKCKLIVAAYNNNERPDYKNSKQRKYNPVFTMGSPSGAGFSCSGYGNWYTVSYVGSRLDYLDYDNMIDATKKFLPEYKQYFTT